MKGAVFLALNELVESQHGIETWEDILQEVNPECEGVYTGVEDYPDEDVVKFVLAISKRLNLEPSEVTRIFGAFLFDELNTKYPLFSDLFKNLFEFLNGIENVIHKEVRKLYDNPNLPTLDCTILSENTMDMHYTSPRKLCYLAEGLIHGAATYYGEEVNLEHNTCMHDGSDHCLIRIRKNER